MSDINYNECKLIRKDILIKLKPECEVRRSAIYYKEDIDNNKIQHFEVLKVAKNVTLVKVGDIVGISWLNCTSQFDGIFDGNREKMGISDEDQVEFILEM